jgi:hypothetical protein
MEEGCEELQAQIHDLLYNFWWIDKLLQISADLSVKWEYECLLHNIIMRIKYMENSA